MVRRPAGSRTINRVGRMPILAKCLVRSRDLVLGTLFERLAEVHGDRPLVTRPTPGSS